MAVAYRVRVAELDHRDRRERGAAVEREPEALPAVPGQRGGAEVRVELRRAVRLGRALDWVERDLANAAAGARLDPRVSSKTASPQSRVLRRRCATRAARRRACRNPCRAPAGSWRPWGLCAESRTLLSSLSRSRKTSQQRGDLDSPRGQKCRRGPPDRVARLGVQAAAYADGTGLSPREREVLRLVTVVDTNREIACDLFLSPRTVDMHVRNILRKPIAAPASRPRAGRATWIQRDGTTGAPESRRHDRFAAAHRRHRQSRSRKRNL